MNKLAVNAKPAGPSNSANRPLFSVAKKRSYLRKDWAKIGCFRTAKLAPNASIKSSNRTLIPTAYIVRIVSQRLYATSASKSGKDSSTVTANNAHFCTKQCRTHLGTESSPYSTDKQIRSKIMKPHSIDPALAAKLSSNMLSCANISIADIVGWISAGFAWVWWIGLRNGNAVRLKTFVGRSPRLKNLRISDCMR